MSYRDTSADITLDNANEGFMATKEQLEKLNADNPSTIAERLSGNYVYPGAVSPMRTPPIEQEAGREIVRLRAEIDALKREINALQSVNDTLIEQLKYKMAEVARLKDELRDDRLDKFGCGRM